MDTQKRILVPLDGSTLAEMALPHACALLQSAEAGGSITLLRVVNTVIAPVTPGWVMSPNLSASEYDEILGERLAVDYTGAVAKRLEALGITVSTEVTEGDPASVIIQYAETHPDIGLIAMSTHGRRGLGRLVFGSVAEAVIHASPVPVLLVRPRAGDTPNIEGATPEYHSIIVPLDGSRFAEQAVDYLKGMTIVPTAHIHLVSGVSDGRSRHESDNAHWQENAASITEYLDEMAAHLRLGGLNVSTHIQHAPPAEAILTQAKRREADLIVMATHSRSGLERIRLGSVALKVVQDATIPVLLVHTKERVAPPVPAKMHQEAYNPTNPTNPLIVPSL